MAVLHDASDAAHVPHCILEQHQVHVGVHFVVRAQPTLENRAETVEGLDSVVV